MKSEKCVLWIAGVSLAICLAVAAPLARAHGSVPWDTPIDRLVKNLEARLEKSPDDAELHYMLGRLHGLAFETANENVPVWTGRGLGLGENPGSDWRPVANEYWIDRSVPAKGGKNEPTDEQMRVHLRQALIHLNRAIELAPALANYHLALASILESGVAMAGEIDVSPCCPVRGAEMGKAQDGLSNRLERIAIDPESLEMVLSSLRRSNFGTGIPSDRDRIVTAIDKKRRDPSTKLDETAQRVLLEDWKEQMVEQFFVALSLALPSDGCRTHLPLVGSADRTAWIAYEAGTSFIRVATARGTRPEDTVRLAVAKTAIDAFNHLPRHNGITPIVFSLDRARPLCEMLDAQATTTFDLNGSGVPQLWPWVSRDTAILCWDPTHSGRITSGRQLFGSVSWWLFFANGYDALDALDDDRDGKLTGAELHGLAVWIDRNGNGVSDPGEVVPIEELGVVELSCRATGSVDDSPCNRAGLRLASGAVLPTYDWIAHPAPEPAR